ncbi:MAG: histidine kinase [Butyrivibrio sp.]|uniref:sensor histidine kinase n=1 Tax=Butyrivibrio sp. TaxID=28121 RepID=UPI0025F47D3D|nr:histidine kinase [Butyrivibrio sp.]MCR5772397.1 histidine kinase [Butyrivibrio sp.]
MKILKKLWLKLSIERKTRIYSLTIIAVVIAVGVFNMFIIGGSINDLGTILSDLTRCVNVQTAFEEENEAFEKYIRNDIDTNKEAYEKACLHTRATITGLPYTYNEIGAERYARTWRIINAYDYYEMNRDKVLKDVLNGELDQKIYDLYDMQNSIYSYIQELTKITVKEGSGLYSRKVTLIDRLPLVLAIISAIGLFLAAGFGRILSMTVTRPLKKLAEGVHDISEKRFDAEDIKVSNEDEIGELVDTFNIMKHAMSEHINTLQENQELTKRIHKEEMEKLEIEKQLSIARLDLLQSQINPHFLFNTLNVISGMAELEGADTTQKMITSLSHLFRYNLRTSSQFVSLSQEISIIDDYMYLQRMRFGSRLVYIKNIDESLDINSITVPALLLQPIVENSVVHGISHIEDGGRIELKVYKEDESLYISVMDTGAGMTRDKLDELNARSVSVTSDHAGIGLTNVKDRIRSLYANSDVTVDSIEGQGTTVTICIRY